MEIQHSQKHIHTLKIFFKEWSFMSTHDMPTIAWRTLKNYLCCWNLCPSLIYRQSNRGPERVAQSHEAELGKAKIGGLFRLTTRWEDCNLLEGPGFRCFLGGFLYGCLISCLQEGLVLWSPPESLHGLRTQLWYYLPVFFLEWGQRGLNIFSYIRRKQLQEEGALLEG